MAIQKERRRFVRLNVLADVAYMKRQPNIIEKFTLAKNISAGGICLIVYEPLKQSGLLDLKIMLPGEKAVISAVGRVVWVREIPLNGASKMKRYDAGIEFMEIRNVDMYKINRYVFEHLQAK
jgi:c-di-GMP-binding flagellar brake protein YcgR